VITDIKEIVSILGITFVDNYWLHLHHNKGVLGFVTNDIARCCIMWEL